MTIIKEKWELLAGAGAAVPLVRIEAPHFVAGIVMDGGVCVEAAPILPLGDRTLSGRLVRLLRVEGLAREHTPESSHDEQR